MAPIQCPEGVEIDLVMYLTSPSTGLQVVVGLRGMNAIAPFSEAPDPREIAQSHILPGLADDWRLMTREEISAYKSDEDGCDGDDD